MLEKIKLRIEELQPQLNVMREKCEIFESRERALLETLRALNTKRVEFNKRQSGSDTKQARRYLRALDREKKEIDAQYQQLKEERANPDEVRDKLKEEIVYLEALTAKPLALIETLRSYYRTMTSDALSLDETDQRHKSLYEVMLQCAKDNSLPAFYRGMLPIVNLAQDLEDKFPSSCAVYFKFNLREHVNESTDDTDALFEEICQAAFISYRKQVFNAERAKLLIEICNNEFFLTSYSNQISEDAIIEHWVILFNFLSYHSLEVDRMKTILRHPETTSSYEEKYYKPIIALSALIEHNNFPPPDEYASLLEHARRKFAERKHLFLTSNYTVKQMLIRIRCESDLVLIRHTSAKEQERMMAMYEEDLKDFLLKELCLFVQAQRQQEESVSADATGPVCSSSDSHAGSRREPAYHSHRFINHPKMNDYLLASISAGVLATADISHKREILFFNRAFMDDFLGKQPQVGSVIGESSEQTLHLRQLGEYLLQGISPLALATFRKEWHDFLGSRFPALKPRADALRQSYLESVLTSTKASTSPTLARLPQGLPVPSSSSVSFAQEPVVIRSPQIPKEAITSNAASEERVSAKPSRVRTKKSSKNGSYGPEKRHNHHRHRSKQTKVATRHGHVESPLTLSAPPSAVYPALPSIKDSAGATPPRRIESAVDVLPAASRHADMLTHKKLHRPGTPHGECVPDDTIGHELLDGRFPPSFGDSLRSATHPVSFKALPDSQNDGPPLSLSSSVNTVPRKLSLSRTISSLFARRGSAPEIIQPIPHSRYEASLFSNSDSGSDVTGSCEVTHLPMHKPEA